MKLSEVIESVRIEEIEEIDEKQYLIISKIGPPYSTVTLCSKDDYRDVMIFKSDTVNIKFLSHYLNLNTKLFKKGGNARKTGYGRVLDHLDLGTIYNIEITANILSPQKKELQDKLIGVIDRLYVSLIGSIEDKINVLFNKNRRLMLNNEYPSIKYCTGSDLFELTNTTLFFRNVPKGNIDPDNEYIVNIDPRYVSTEYLLYYLFYSGIYSGEYYNNGEFDINEFDISSVGIELPILEDQIKIIQSIYNNHNKLMKLEQELKLNKATLRELIDNLL